MKLNKIFWVTVGLMTLTACSSPVDKTRIMTYITTDSAPVSISDPDTENQLTQAAQSVSESLENLSAVEIASHPSAKIAPPANAHRIGMAQTASLEWSGPIQALLKKIAQSSGYRLQVLGTQPSIPVIVAISKHNVALATILRDAIFQAQQQADINVYPSSKIIELRYHQ